MAYSLKNIYNAHLFDTSEVTTFSMAFCGHPFGDPSPLEYIDVSTWDLSNCTCIDLMFANCPNLTELDVSNWDVSKITSMLQAFCLCNSLTELKVSNWDTGSCTSFMSMIDGCNNLKIFDCSNWDISSCVNLWGFFGATGLESIDLSKWNTSHVTSMRGLFSKSNKLKTVNLSGWDFSKVTNMREMFQGCSMLTGLNVADWNTSSCMDMGFMFYGCSSLGEIDVSNWDVSKVQNFDHFAAHANLRRKGIEKWNTSSATNMNAMFHYCAEEELDLSGWDVSKVQFFCQMFENSPNLKHIKGLEKWNTSSGLGFDEMFGRCSKLEEVDLSSFDTAKAKNGTSASTNGHKTATLQNMFLSCNNLKKVTLGPNFSINGDGSNTDAANKLILPTPSTDYIEGADGNWYVFNGDSYTPDAVKDKTAETYYASYAMVANMDVIVKNGSLIDTAKAIREKNGTDVHYNPSQFGAAIRTLT